jgi:Na+-transporting methylmalonyl-CoA/oxaloacetate decarboxylase gamma subunit
MPTRVHDRVMLGTVVIFFLSVLAAIGAFMGALERKRVEMRFAHLKTHHGFERMRLRGLSGARDEFHLAAIVQNLKTLALRILGPPPRPTPAFVA